MSDVFARPKVSPDCLSAWQVSQVAIGESQEAQTHLEECTHCAARVEAETTEVRAAAYEEVPAALLQSLPPKRGVWIRRIAGTIALAAAGLLLALWPTDDPSGVRIKGDVPVSLTVMRGDSIIAREVPVESVVDLRTGDRLRLRVHVAESTWIVLQGLESRAWALYYSGPLPADRWLPVGLALTPDGETRLRLYTCDAEPVLEQLDSLVDTGACARRAFGLGSNAQP